MSKHQQSLKHSNGTSVLVKREEHSFSGPLPHPEILRQFEQVSPGAAERNIKMAEDQSIHLRELEKQVISSDISRSKWGQILGFIISICGLSASAFIAIFGNPIAGTIIGVGTIASLVGVFMYGSNIRNQERERKNGSN